MAPPDVDFGPLGEADTVRLASGVEMVEELLTTAPFADVVADARVVDGFGGYAHATSTCAMGTVVDEHGAVVGYEDLFVADASVLPMTPPSGTYLPSCSSPSASPTPGANADQSGWHPCQSDFWAGFVPYAAQKPPRSPRGLIVELR